MRALAPMGGGMALGFAPPAAPAGGEAPGGELVTNGDFAAGSTGWTLLGPTVTGGQLVFDDADGDGHSAAQAIAIEVGHTYRVAYTISNRIGGSALVRVGGATPTGRIANGSYSEDLVAVSTAGLLINGFDVRMRFDDVSVTEVP